MKIKFTAGGRASRAEVYGLFLAATVLLGGGIGGAYAITTSLSPNDEADATTVALPGIVPASETPTDTGEIMAEDAVVEGSPEFAEIAEGVATPQPESSAPIVPKPVVPKPVVTAPVAPAPIVVEPVQPAPIAAPPADSRIQEPYIGPADTFSYLARSHICGWDTQALGGFGWGYDPAEPCNAEFVAYVGEHCTANDGVIFDQRCDQYFSRTLPVIY